MLCSFVAVTLAVTLSALHAEAVVCYKCIYDPSDNDTLAQCRDDAWNPAAVGRATGTYCIKTIATDSKDIFN